MSLELDLTDDYLVFDGLEAVVLESVRRGGSPAVYPVSHAKRQKLTNKEILTSGGGLSSRDIKWQVPKKLVGSYQPKIGDIVRDEKSGVGWTVIDWSFKAFSELWTLTARNLALVFDLYDLCDIERAEITRDDAGAYRKRFPPNGGTVAYSQLPCRLQPQESSITEERGVKGFKTTFDLILDREIVITDEDRVKVGELCYEVRGYRQAEQVGQPPVVTVELVP